MHLSSRKILILEAIINDYIATAEPIGSRTIAKKYELGISSATIRNEMSDLEEMGLIIQPHASAGRVPSNRGYRLYVDKLMKKRELTEDEVAYLYQVIHQSIDQVDSLMQEAAKAITLLTNYTTIVRQPSSRRIRMKHLQLIPFDDKAVVMVIVTNNKSVRNHVIKTGYAVEADVLIQLSNLFNSFIIDKPVELFTKELQDEIIAALPEHAQLIGQVFEAAIGALGFEENAQVFLSGTKNILEYPEFSDIDKAKNIIEAFEQKDILLTLLDDTSEESFSIVIGDENDIHEMHDCSIIRSNITMGGDTTTSIGILGPTRMDYSQGVSILKTISESINQALKLLTGG